MKVATFGPLGPRLLETFANLRTVVYVAYSEDIYRSNGLCSLTISLIEGTCTHKITNNCLQVR